MKKMCIRCFVGALLGVGLSTLITVLISLCSGDGTYYPVVPQLAEDMGGELRAMLLQTLLSMLYGAAFAGANVVWTQEWSLTKMTVVHLVILSLATLPVAYFAYWMPHTVRGVLLYLALFFAIYACIWVGQYLGMKKNVSELNKCVRGV